MSLDTEKQFHVGRLLFRREFNRADSPYKTFYERQYYTNLTFNKRSKKWKADRGTNGRWCSTPTLAVISLMRAINDKITRRFMDSLLDLAKKDPWLHPTKSSDRELARTKLAFESGNCEEWIAKWEQEERHKPAKQKRRKT